MSHEFSYEKSIVLPLACVPFILERMVLEEFGKPLWDGSPLSGRTILLYPDQGIGDTIQLLRYAVLIKQSGGKVAFVVNSPSPNIFERCSGVDDCVTQGRPYPDFDVHAPVSLLPVLFGTTNDTIPAPVPYFSAEPALIEHWRNMLSPIGGYKIAVCWQGSPHYSLDRQRSFPLSALAPIADIAGVTLISLQKGEGESQVNDCGFSIVSLGDRLDALGLFMDTAAIMHGVQLVIGCDTAVTHLAGALGVPAILALSDPHEPRWPSSGNMTAWYPGTRLFRQETPGDWPTVFQRIATKIAAIINGQGLSAS